MAGIWGSYSRNEFDHANVGFVTDALDPLGQGQRYAYSGNGVHAVACQPPRRGARAHVYEDADRLVLAAGSLTRPALDRRTVDWLAQATPGQMAETLRGTFALAIVCKRTQRIRLVSDRTSQQPLYWRKSAGGFVFSTTMATFCRLVDAPPVDRNWLYEFLYFNYPVLDRTFLAGVARMPPATVLDYDPAADAVTMSAYAPRYAVPETLLDEEASVERALATFPSVLERCMESPRSTGVAVTSGMDSRTLLSFAARHGAGGLRSYTYGVPRCLDLDHAAQIAGTMGIPHTEIALGERFRGALPDLVYWTVFLSGGLQRIDRATLPYAYSTLAGAHEDLDTILHGAAGDHLFRDHLRGTGNRPHILSRDLHATLQSGRYAADEALFRQLLGHDYEEFDAHTRQAVGRLEEAYGPLGDPEAYMNLLIYEAGPKYFAGESEIAGHWFHVERPYMDPDLAELAYASIFGVAAVSRHAPGQDRFHEKYFQARLIAENPAMGMLPLYDRPLRTYLSRRKWRYHFDSARLAPRRLLERLGPPRPLLETWDQWFAVDLRQRIGNLLGDDSLLGRRMPAGAIRAVANGADTHLAAKLATAEILLELVGNRWQLPPWLAEAGLPAGRRERPGETRAGQRVAMS